MAEDSFSLDQAMAAQRVMRAKLALPPERFPLQALIGMLSDEIEQLRLQGENDQAIASIIAKAVVRPISATDVEDNFASADDRPRHSLQLG